MHKRGKHRFELGFEVEFSHDGKFQTFNAIDMASPGLKYFDFYTTVEGWMAEAMFSMASKMDDIQKIIDSVDKDEARKKVKQGGGRGQLDMLKGAMGHEDYSKFVAYIRKHLTNTPLAMIADSNRTIDADTWEAIAEQGGMEVVLQVIGEYLDFFSDTKAKSSTKPKPSPAPNGSGLSVTPA